MIHQTSGIVLNTVKYGDTSIIAHIYTDVFGRQSYMVNGVRKAKSRISINLFQPLTILKLEADHKNTREIQRLKDIKMAYQAIHISQDIRKNSIALFISEVLYRTLKEVEPNPVLFNYLSDTIKVLDMCEEGASNFHLVFLLQYSRFIGIYPENHKELDLYQPKEARMHLEDLLDYSVGDLAHLSLDHHSRKILLDAIVQYYHDHLEGMGNINSLDILHEVFAGN